MSQTVLTKVESYCDIVKKSCKQSVVTTENIRTAFTSVNEKEDRSKKMIRNVCQLKLMISLNIWERVQELCTVLDLGMNRKGHVDQLM